MAPQQLTLATQLDAGFALNRMQTVAPRVRSAPREALIYHRAGRGRV